MSFLLQLLVLGLFTFYFFFLETPVDKSHRASGLNQVLDITSDHVSAPQAPAQVMKDVLLTEFQSDTEGQKEWVLEAKTALSDSFEQTWDVQDSRVKFYKNNSELVRIAAVHGAINTSTRNLELHQDVKGETESGYIFQTTSLSYVSDQERFFSKSSIYFESPGQNTKLSGSGMDGSISSGLVEISGPIECHQHIEGYQKATIKSQTAQMSLQERHMIFRDNLFIQIDDIAITGQRAEFVYSKTKGELEMLRIQGRVFVTSGDRSASAERLEIQLKEDLFLFQGNPRFVSGENVLVGNEIVLYDKGKRVQILKGQVKSEAPKSLTED
ncbi:MAG: LPS export ABC transporter periplasmic protein LptC [Bdellovibrionaceae bacterium]|nr:LPS export ABC transporter periplasmic protein LptC [Pseudobdellovibrionaceae bacterium]